MRPLKIIFQITFSEKNKNLFTKYIAMKKVSRYRKPTSTRVPYFMELELVWRQSLPPPPPLNQLEISQ
jgi:hypothetical protein